MRATHRCGPSRSALTRAVGVGVEHRALGELRAWAHRLPSGSVVVVSSTLIGASSPAAAVYLLFVVAAWVAFFGGIGYVIGSQKDRSGAGFWFGVLLGVVGWIVVGLMEPSDAERLRRNQEMTMSLRGDDAAVVDTNFAMMSARDRARAKALGRTTGLTKATGERSCPWCAESIRTAAVVCRFCGREVQPWTAAERTLAKLGSASATTRAAMVFFVGELAATSRGSLGTPERDPDDDALMGPFNAPGRPWDQRAQARYQAIVDEALELASKRHGWVVVDNRRLPTSWAVPMRSWQTSVKAVPLWLPSLSRRS